jgi:two-component sensor histidine kinase
MGLLGLSLLAAGCSGASERFQARAGVLDLRAFDFHSPHVVSLIGQWDFISNDLSTPWEVLAKQPARYREVPDLWKDKEAGGKDGHGAATYHLTVLLPADQPALAIRYISASTAFRLEAQGNPLVQVGVPALRAEDSLAAYLPGTVRLPPVTDRLELTVRVSNHVYRVGGLWFPFELGSAKTVEDNALVSFSVALGHAVALGAMAMILVVLFLLRPQERAFLYSGLLALTLAIRVLATGDYILTRFWPSIPFDLLIRIEYLSVFVCFPIATALFLALVPKFLSRSWAIGCASASLVFVVFALTFPLDLLTRTINGYYAVAFLTILLFMRSFWVHALKARNNKAILLFVGALVLALSIINDVFYSSFLWKTGNLGTWGFLFFVVTLVWIDFRRLTSAFSEVEELVAQKDLLIMEIHHRVRNNLQMVSGLVSLQTKRVLAPEAKEALASLRSRVVSMALVHEKLYGKVSTDFMDLGEYLRELIQLLVPKEAVEDGTVKLSMTIQPLRKSAKVCLDIGLLVTELINNAMKHSLLPRGGGTLGFKLSLEGTAVVILVEDDGPGFGQNFNPGQSQSLGYKLIDSLLRQNRGTWTILPGPGGRVLIRLE